jgi:hypothetical protein
MTGNRSATICTSTWLRMVTSQRTETSSSTLRPGSDRISMISFRLSGRNRSLRASIAGWSA